MTTLAPKRTRRKTAQTDGSVDAEAIGARIAQARREAGGMEQKELAAAIGVIPRSVQNYESGRRIPWKLLDAIGQATGKSKEWLLHGDGVGDASTGGDDEILASLARIETMLEELLRRG